MQRIYICSKRYKWNDEKIDSIEDNEPTFLSSYFLEKPVFTVETIKERLNEMNLDRAQKKGKKCSSHEYKKDIIVQHKKREGTLPRIVSLAKMNTSEAEFSDETSYI